MQGTYADHIKAYDSTDMYSVLTAYPDQIRKGIETGYALNIDGIDTASIQSLVICGMGGSAISGDILRVFMAAKSHVPVFVNRDYRLPAWVGPEALVVVMSYSGGTEESLAAYEEAAVRGAMRVVVTSGGELYERAGRDDIPFALVPGGLAPRCALGYLFFPLFLLAVRCKLFNIEESSLDILIEDAESLTRHLSDFLSDNNRAVHIADILRGTIPVIYGSQSFMDAVLLRWRCQIEENAKVLAFSNVLPEMNHNEIVGWERLPELLRRFTVIALNDTADSDALKKRMSVTLDILRPLAATVIEVYAEEENELSRLFGLILLGDWVSFYLAVGSGVDPFPIHNIDHLKNALKRL